ncbi:ciliary microtubule inner protein 2A [Leptosomus discolor]
MAAPKENSLFPPSPYYIPGYQGFVPQYNYQFGDTFGKTTYRLLTDPGVRKSPHSLLAPLHKQKIVEDFSRTNQGVQCHLPGPPAITALVREHGHPESSTSAELEHSASAAPPTSSPSLAAEHEAVRSGTSLWPVGFSCPSRVPSQLPVHPQPIAGGGPKSGQSSHTLILCQSLSGDVSFGDSCATYHTTCLTRYFPYENAEASTSFPEPVLGPKPSPPGLAEEEMMMMHMDPVPQHHPDEYIPRTQLAQGYPQEFSLHPASEERELKVPKLTPACGKGLSAALARSKLPVKIEGVTVPGVAQTGDVEQDNLLPKLEVPNAIQQKVIPGYTGFIPRLTWINGVNYSQGVKEAMNEFDQYQFLQRNPACSFGKRFPQTYWPANRIYTSAGLIPSYTGFVPYLRDTYALTFSNSTRKAYQKEQRRRACAL